MGSKAAGAGVSTPGPKHTSAAGASTPGPNTKHASAAGAATPGLTPGSRKQRLPPIAEGHELGHIMQEQVQEIMMIEAGPRITIKRNSIAQVQRELEELMELRDDIIALDERWASASSVLRRRGYSTWCELRAPFFDAGVIPQYDQGLARGVLRREAWPRGRRYRHSRNF